MSVPAAPPSEPIADERELRHALDEDARLALRALALIVGIVELTYVLVSPLLRPPDIVARMRPVELIIGIAALVGFFAFRPGHVPARFAQAASAGLLAALTAQSLSALRVDPSLIGQMGLGLIVFATPLLFTSVRWFVLAIALPAGGWWYGLLVLEPRSVAGPVDAAIVVLAVVALASTLFVLRRRALRRIVLARTMAARREAQLERTVHELRAMHEQLEAFTSMASHDLRAPLRSIDSLGMMIEEDLKAGATGEARANLMRLRASSHRATALVSDLMRLGHAGRGTLHLANVDLSDLARDILATLAEGEAAGRSVDTRVETGLTARCDPAMLRVALENLLGNAWKYTRHAAAPLIEFGAQRENGDVVYYVRDNGAGFPMALAHRLFVPFQRLHDTREFEGSGVGPRR